MPVIAFANSKGGTGKSTACLALGSALAHHGYTVTLLDCDPNRPLATWRDQRATPSPMRILDDVHEDNVVDRIKREAAERQFVLVDLEGAATSLVSRAISRANLVIIPMQASAPDAHMAAKALRLVEKEEEVLERHIPSTILFTRTAAAFPINIEKELRAELDNAKAPYLEVSLHERVAFKHQFTDCLTVYEMVGKKISGVQGAIENADLFMMEVLKWVVPAQSRSVQNSEVA